MSKHASAEVRSSVDHLPDKGRGANAVVDGHDVARALIGHPMCCGAWCRPCDLIAGVYHCVRCSLPHPPDEHGAGCYQSARYGGDCWAEQLWQHLQFGEPYTPPKWECWGQESLWEET